MRSPSTGGSKARGTVERLLHLAVRLGSGQAVTQSYIMDRYDVSLATAKRDMTLLESTLPLVSEGGGKGVGMPKRTLRLMPGAKLVPLLVAKAA